MGEPTPPLATYPGPKKQRPSKGGLAERVAFLVIGLVIGGALVTIALRSRQPEARVVYQAPPPVTAPKTPTTQPPDPKDGKATTPVPPAETTKPPAETKPTGIQPFNPFDGSFAAPMPQKEINGHITAGPGVRLPAVGDGSPISAPPEAADHPTPKGLLVTLRLDVADTNAAVRALQSVASKEGGSAIRFDETAGKPDAEGAVIFVPAAKADEAERAIGAIGGVVVSDRWTGSSSDRLDRIEQAAVDHLSDLHVKRQELLIKYFDDAPQIKHIDEDTDRINKCIAELRSQKQDANMAVIKIRFLS